MKPIKKSQLLIVVTLTLLATLITYPVRAQNSTPAVPQFSLQYIDGSYYVPPTYTTNQYTGVTTMATAGYTVTNQTIDVTIQNQPFTPYSLANGTTIQLLYNVRCKGHYAQFTSDTDLGSYGIGDVQASTSATTVVSFNINDWGVPSGGQVDFQVQAFIGYNYFNEGECFTQNVVVDGESSWSNTQTITIGSESSSTTNSSTPFLPSYPTPTPYATYNPTPTPSPAYPTTAPIQLNSKGAPFALGGFDWQETALIVMVAVTAILVGVLVAVLKWRKDAAK